MPLNNVRVKESALRLLFNRKYLARFQRGEFTLVEHWRGVPHVRAYQPPGTKSIIYEFYDRAGDKLGKFHVYELPDGTYGGSGQPDPKELIIGRNRLIASPD